MAQQLHAPGQRPAADRVEPNIYTLLLIIAILALALTVGVVLWNLLATPPDGYGMSFGDLFTPFELPGGLK